MHLEATAEGLREVAGPTSGPLGVVGQSPIVADLIFPATGARPDNTLLKAMPGAAIDGLGRVVVDEWLRPAGARNVFALG